MNGDSLNAQFKAIDEKLDGLTPINAEEHCIFKVHDQLLKVNMKAYKPVLLAIGPYNKHGKVAKGLMEEHKLRYLKQIRETRNDRSVKEYIMALRKLEGRARKCYAECITQTKDEFVEMMLLDGCFIIELFRKWERSRVHGNEHDPIFQLDWMLSYIARDLLLFENQLPFFVLTKLFEMIESGQTSLPNQSEHLGEHTIKIEQNNEITCSESSTSIDQSVQIRRFGDLALRFFYGAVSLPFQWNVNGSSSYSINNTKHLLCRSHKAITPPLAKIVYEHLQVGDKFKNANFKHLLDLIHTIIRLSVLDMELHHAKKSQEVGVKFKKEEIFEKLFALIRKVESPLLAKLEHMKKGHKKKSLRYAIELEKSKLSYSPKRIEDWNSIPYGTQLQEAGVEFEMAEKFKENLVWNSIPQAIAFQEAEIELEKAKGFLNLLCRNRKEEDKKELCPTRFKMVEKFMRLPFLNKIENWNSISNGREFKKAGVEFKKAKKFRDTKNMMKSIPNATELKEGGVKFKKAKQRTTFFIQFSNGVLKISPLRIEDETETFLRNLIAYEQNDPYKVSNYVTNYMCFMDDLIDSPKDVELLRQKGIIENWLGEDKVVSTMVNKLGHHVTFSPSNSIYVKTSIDLNKHCAKRWNVWMAKLRHNYFNGPWALLSVLAAIILLGLAITQTVFSIIH